MKFLPSTVDIQQWLYDIRFKLFIPDGNMCGMLNIEKNFCFKINEYLSRVNK